MKRLFILTIAVSLILVTSFCYAKDRLEIVSDLKGQDKAEVELLNVDMPKFQEDLAEYRDRLAAQSELNTDKEEKEYLMGLAIEVHEVIEDIDEVLMWTGQKTEGDLLLNDDILSP